MRTLGIIPARLASSRLPAKMLALLAGQSVLERTWRQATKATKLDGLVVAADHESVAEHAQNFGASVLMTRNDHQNGTERAAEVAALMQGFDLYLNIQGDEPLLPPSNIDLLVELMQVKMNADLGTLVTNFGSLADVENSARIKVVCAADGKALYFSRAVLPYFRAPAQPHLEQYRQHIGLYAYRAEILQRVAALKPSALEQAESLEQLRWLEHGLSIYTAYTSMHSRSVDTPEDIVALEALLAGKPI